MLGQTTFRRMKEPLSKIMSTRTLSFSYVRLMPKTLGFRPIINLRRKIIPRRVTPKERLYAQSINSMLHNSFQILKYESSKILDESATVTGMSDVYMKLKCFQTRMRCKRPEKLYFVKADIVQCFDNINQEMLMDIITDVINEEEYLVHKYSKAYANVGKIKKRFSKVAKNSAEFTQFGVLAQQLSSELRNVILTDGVLHSFEERDCLLELLEEHICNNLVKLSLLSLYLSHMEKNKLKKIMSCNDLLLRLVDDFLFITPSKEKAIQFTKLLHEGVSEYGCTVNPLKTVVNFDLVQSGITLSRVESLSPLKERGEFPWCGLLINMKNLSVKVDYTRLAGCYIGESLTVEFCRRPWVSLQLKMFHYIIPKSHPLLLDTSMNSETVVLLNIYQNFLICGMKLHAHMQRIIKTLKCSVPNAEYLMGIIQTTINYMQRLVHSRIKKKIVVVGTSGRQEGLGSCKVPQYLLKVEWLGFRAFARVLNRKQTSFKTLIEQLNAAQNDEKYDRLEQSARSLSH
ncbi:hypothetical protein HDU81_009857 [Chytriomyces hyalinus]|nr:hypothetical protein HDU81_009857 [Chytriomyces hyalinus]